MKELIKIKDYTKPKYENISELYDNRALVYIQDRNSWRFINGGMEFQTLFGYIDADGNEVIPCKYHGAENFSEGLAYVREGEHRYIIDTNGNIAFELRNNYKLGATDGYFSNGLLMVQNTMTRKWGYINKKGEEVIPCIYDFAHRFSEGLALVFKRNENTIYDMNKVCVESYYIDRNGIGQIFANKIYVFSMGGYAEFMNGIAPVIDRKLGAKSNTRKYINKKGEIIKNYTEKEWDLAVTSKLEKTYKVIEESVEKNLVEYYADIIIGDAAITLKAPTKEELTKQKKELILLIKSRLELEMQNIDKEETITNTHKSSK